MSKNKIVKAQRKKRQQSSIIKYNSFNQSKSSIINDVINSHTDNDLDPVVKPTNTGGNEVDDDCLKKQNSTLVATTHLKNQNVIMIPPVETMVKRNLSTVYLKKIHGGKNTKKNRLVAVELCLLFLSQLESANRSIINETEPEGWKSLRAEYLRQLLYLEPQTYINVQDALTEFYYKDNGPILEKGNYRIGSYSYRYRLTDNFRNKKYKAYMLQTDVVKKLFKKSCERKLKKAKDNIICTNLIEFYKTVKLPTKIEINTEANQLISDGYSDKKGRRLMWRNKRSKERLANISNVCYVEDAIEVFENLTFNGLMIPKPGNAKSGGRVVDSFTLMPSWIRRLIKINGKPMSEADYCCLHPNLAIMLYGGNSIHLTHEKLAVDIGIDKKFVKIEHLSFFNKKVSQMEKSSLWHYYKKYEPDMLKSIISEKMDSQFKHKITSRLLFAKEVEIMTEVIRRLNEEGIFVGYIYDALFFDPENSEKIVSIMNDVAYDFKVFTIAKPE
jgi:hypothetical protein